MSTPGFLIDRVVPSIIARHVDVHVSYDGGGMILTFPDSYPQGVLLAQVRNEVRSRLKGEEAKARLGSLVGRHDL